MPGAHSFPKEVRLRRRGEFLRVQDRGVKFTADCLLCLVLPTPSPAGNGAPAPSLRSTLPRLGLTVSSKVGNAVVRNRIRRQLRELFRVRKEALPRGLDMVLIARSSAAEADTERLSKAFERVVKELTRKYGAPAAESAP